MSHLVAVLVIGLTVTALQCLCSSHPYAQKVNSGLMPRHSACATRLASSHHLGIVSSHSTPRRVSTVQQDILRERLHLYNFYYKILLCILFYY